ncbi:MAG: helix-turn-helix domain-containing protein [Armatimonadetes bacterium]|nr:helix-turn-helix domain-containing protein [Armatimonadota bacterium]
MENILGGLAGAAEESERLRHTLYVYLKQGENAAAASRCLFMHRNTLKYRIDQAKRLLPEPLETRRLDVALALTYCDWVPVWQNSEYSALEPESNPSFGSKPALRA